MDITPDRIEQFNRNLLYKTVGIELEWVGNGRAESRLSPPPQVCWPFPDQPHGGMLFTIMDTTMAWAVQSRLETGASCTTIDLTIQYLAPAKEGPFTCRAETTHQTRHLAFVRADILDARNRPLASGQGTFRIIKFDFK
ncbi:MAG: PaaI family thioesterase [Deltaproteobacteria bacterium]|nr:PaaI family thioesterase [Deltaproteobacteria bacterium]